MEAEGQFGRIVLRTELVEVFSLDLYETPELTCRGAYLPGPRSPLGPLRFIEEDFRTLPTAIPQEVELVATQEAMEEIAAINELNRHETFSEGRLFFELYAQRFELIGVVSGLAVQPNVEQGVATGKVFGFGTGFDFFLERYGSPEIGLSCSTRRDFPANLWRPKTERHVCGMFPAGYRNLW